MMPLKTINNHSYQSRKYNVPQEWNKTIFIVCIKYTFAIWFVNDPGPGNSSQLCFTIDNGCLCFQLINAIFKILAYSIF